MDNYMLVKHEKKANLAHPIKLFSNPSALKSMTTELGWKIFREMVSPACPIDIAKKIGVHEQKVYYYIRKFRDSGLIKEIRKEQRHGTLARFYQVKDSCMGLIVDKNCFETMQVPIAPAFRSLEPFVSGGKMNCRIVVGSPDPHGPFKARASDSCCAIDFALFLGSFTNGEISPNYKLDVETRTKDMKGNLIVIGGPAVNMVMSKLNKYLPIQMERRGDEIAVVSKVSGKKYFDEEIGFVALTKNPFNPKSSVMVLAGRRFQGTRSAVLGFVGNIDEILKGNKFDKNVKAKIVKGFDMNSDGIIDSVEFLE
ncbi:MAG: hypothetical protein ABIH90_01085 [Candidatus Aenigmatarchaeota archaeon]